MTEKCWLCDEIATKKVYPDKDPMDVSLCCDNHIIDSFTEHEGHWVVPIEVNHA